MGLCNNLFVPIVIFVCMCVLSFVVSLFFNFRFIMWLKYLFMDSDGITKIVALKKNVNGST